MQFSGLRSWERVPAWIPFSNSLQWLFSALATLYISDYPFCCNWWNFILCNSWVIILLLLSHFSRVRVCDSIDGSPPGSPIPGILQARTLEWVAISFSNAWKWKVKVKSLSGVWLLVTPWTAAHQAPLSMGFARQEYWSGVPLPSPNHLTKDI